MSSKYFRCFFHSSLLALQVLTLQAISAQHANISFEHFTMEHGLSAPVTQIIQDNYGFLWFGTSDGLNRFDGTTFNVYRNIPGDTTSIPSNIINSLVPDAAGRVWAATNRGICYFDFNDDRFHTIKYNDTLEVLDRHRVHAIAQGNDNSIWFASRTWLHQWKDGKVISTLAMPAYPDLLIKYLYIDDKDRKWIGSNEGLHMHDPKTGKFLHAAIHSPFTIANKLKATVHPVKTYKNDTLMIGSWYADMQKVYLSGDKIINIPFPDPFGTDPRSHIVQGLAQGTNDIWWIGTYGNGISWFDVKRNQFIDHFRYVPSDPESLSSDYINDIFKDASGIVWIGTTKGLDKYDPLVQQFKSIPLPVQPSHFAVYRLANTIVEDKDNPHWLWLCVSGVGLFHYNIHTQHFDLYQLESESENQQLSNNLYSFFYDSKGRIWIGTRLGVYLFDPQTKKFKDSPLKDNKAIQGAHTIIEDRNGDFWFATNSNGIYRFSEKDKQLRSYIFDPDNPNSIPDNKIFCLIEDSQGKLWISTQNRGMCRYDPRTEEYIHFQHTKNDPNTIPDNGVFVLYEDENNQLWIGTENGLAVMDMATLAITQYSTNDGLCNNTVFSITPDGQGRLWLGTNNGLSNFNPPTKHFRNYYIKDGLPQNRIDGEVFFSMDNNILFLATTGVLTFCEPDKMQLNTRIPSIILTDYTILGKEVPVMRNKEMLLPIHLSYKENMITFNFAALNYSNSFLNQYAYKLEGFDADWIYCGSKQSATYTNLNGGTYTFRVKGANNDGIWNERGTSVLLYVHPPFWKTWWFYLLVALAIGAVLYAYYRMRINQLIRLQNIRTRIARDLHDDIGSTLSSINMISSMADQTKVNSNKSTELFHTIASASGQAMDLMSDIVWSINPKNDRMEMIIIRMRQYASEILEAANISFSLEIDDEGRDVLLPLEIRKDFYLIFKEAINNLAKYSKADHVVIRLNFKNQMIHLFIHDNGIGFDPASASSGNGLKNMKARASHLKGQLNIHSGHREGTTVDLTIPLTP